ncbi:unnamed protein product [Closterium sp. Naga37s-1]|nr:unnamed protein product [Closterium sp. Naga37s-1]
MGSAQLLIVMAQRAEGSAWSARPFSRASWVTSSHGQAKQPSGGWDETSFLGHFQPRAGQAAIWELGSDQHLHGATGRGVQAGEVEGEQGQLSGGRGVEGGGMMGTAAMPSASFSPSLASLHDVSDALPRPMDLSLLPSHV